VLEHGVLDWKQVSMGLREFVSNAIDGNVVRKKSAQDVKIERVAPAMIGGKAGMTRIFVKLADSVDEYVNNLKTAFLHFSGQENEKIIKNEGGEHCRIYKKGVVVRQLPATSVFHYNSRNIYLDESRNADTYHCKRAIADAVSDMDVDNLSLILKSIHANKGLIEYNLPDDSVWLDKKTAEAAWKAAFGDGILCSELSALVIPHLKSKGLSPIVMPNYMYTALSRYNIPSDFNHVTRDNDECLPPTDEMIAAVDKAWDVCAIRGHNLKQKPKVYGFKPIMDGQNMVFGKYQNESVYLHQDLSGQQLFVTALEEVIHHITGATDMSRAFQQYMLDIIARLAY